MNAYPQTYRRAGAPRPDELAPSLLESLEARQLLAVDLVAAFISSTTHTLAPGEDFTAAMVVNNDGNDNAPAFNVEMRMSADSIFGNSDDIVLDVVERPQGIDAESSISILRTFTIPDSAPAGDYFLAFSVDPTDAVSESNESNNVYFSASSIITVIAGSENVDLDVYGNGQEIADGAHVPTADNHSFFGDVDVGDTFDRVYTLTNDGAGTLQILDISIGGVHSLDFSIIGASQFSIGAGQSMNLTVRFTPLAEGIRVGQIQIQTNDTDDGTGDPSAYSFAISGDAHGVGNPTGPEIEVTGNGQSINDGDVSPVPADHSSFGRIRLSNASQTRTFTVFNTGDETLTFTGLSMDGRNAGDFVILDDLTSIAPGDSATFRVRFDPSANGRRVAVVRLNSNDADEGQFTFKVAGRGAVNGGPGDGAPEIDVQGNGQSISDGDTSPSPSDHTRFGRVGRIDQTRARTYTIFNSGSSMLNISSILLTGRDADNFVVLDAPTEVAPGSSETFRVRFDPDGLGARRADVVINSNDADEGTCTFRIRGNGVNNTPAEGGEGEITVSGLLPLFDGDETPTFAEGTNFGPTNSGQTVTRIFTITNTGSGVLNLTGPLVTITGRNAARFAVVQQPDATIGVGETTTFIVQFTPTNGGRKFATIEIHSSDANEAVFNFDIVGRGMPA